MEEVLWYTFLGTRGGLTRLEIVAALDERPRNANRLAEDLDLDYTTVRHHLDVLEDNEVVTAGGEGYGTVYLPSDTARRHWDTIETIMDQVTDT